MREDAENQQQEDLEVPAEGQTEGESLADRNASRSRTPQSEAFQKYIGSSWADSADAPLEQDQVAPFAHTRRERVADAFRGKLLVIEAGAAKTRSNDTEYRYRAHSAFSHLTGWGTHTVPDSVLVIDARTAQTESTLYFRPTAGRDTDEFFANSAIGEFWVGARPGLTAVSSLLGIRTADLKDLEAALAKVPAEDQLSLTDDAFAEFVSELRLVKDSYEIAQMRDAVAASVAGFENVVRNLESASNHPRGERIVEAAFFAEARVRGNDLGYETIAASGEHACTLHWIVNDGPVRKGDLILLDAGVEVDSLYTADVTRTMPIDGKFSPVQRMIYEAVREAADAAFAVAKPGVVYKEMHAAAMRVIATKAFEWGLLPDGVTAEQSLETDKQFHRRWMIHGTGHHLGLDVHDCAQARRDMYHDAVLQEGMILTIEPGLYFHKDDLLVPEEFRGIGVRIEDDVLITKDGCENLTAALPRSADDVERWMAALR